MGIKAIDLRRGVAVEWNNKLYTVHDFAKVSKGNWRSFMQVKLRDTGTGSIIEQRFRVDDELEPGLPRPEADGVPLFRARTSTTS